MLTSISPLGERARHNRWAATTAWYSAASVLAGAAVGATAGAVGAVADPGQPTAGVLLAVACLAAAGADAGRLRPPGLRRQVDEDWLGRYRGWVYGAGFGAQLGAGVATIVATWAVWLVLAAEVLTGSVVGGAFVGVVFGAVRSLPLLSGAALHSHDDLRRRHATLLRWAPPVRWAAVAVMALAGLGAAAGVLQS